MPRSDVAMSEGALDAPPGAVITPRDEGDVVDAVREANDARTPLRIVGAGNWLDAGRPVRAESAISTTKLSGIVDYVPGDLVLTARAGTTLAELAKVTSAHGQWFALDPYGSSAGTLGATVATASSGPLSTGFGRARDLVLGLTAVTGDGQQIRVGGRVVKNVAGFDLVRLLTGSWGTLAIITEISIRLHALPQQETTVMVHLAGASLDAQLASLRQMPLSTMALLLLDSRTASLVSDRNVSTPVLLVRLGGNAERVNAQRALLAQFGRCEHVPDDVWTRLRELELRTSDGAPFVLRASGGAARAAALFSALTAVGQRSDAGAYCVVSPLDGVVRIISHGTSASPYIQSALTIGARVIGERLTRDDWARLPDPMNDLANGIRRRFDPAGILNRGMFDHASTSTALS